VGNLSTAGLPPWHKQSFWNEIANEHNSQLEIEVLDLERFDGTLNRVSAGPVDLISVYCAAAHVRHARPENAGDAEPGYLLVTPLHRQFELRAGAAAPVVVGTGDICLLDLAQPHDAVHSEGVRLLCVDIPRPTLEAQIPGVQRLAGQLLAQDSVASRTLSGLLQTLGRELASGSISELPHQMGTSLLGLIAAAYQPQLASGNQRGARTCARAYRGYIDLRLTEPGLKPASVASHFGISERYLRMVLKADGENFSSYLLRRRLMRCAQRLRDPRYAGTTIMEIALGAGFSSATHFADAFKARYGQCPREYRKEPGPGKRLEHAAAAA
jgi:AraC-like DNA-binding protein